MDSQTEVMGLLSEILTMDDKILEDGFEQLIEMFEASTTLQQSKMQKIAHCRANNLTEDDLIQENNDVESSFVDLVKELSPIKQKFLKYLLDASVKINNAIIEDGLYSRAKVRVQILEHNEQLPSYAHEIGDSGLDVFVTEDIEIPSNSVVMVPTGIKVAIPLGYELQVRPRSGFSAKDENVFLMIANSPGTIDANYRDEIKILVKNFGLFPRTLTRGTRIAQLILAPVIKLEWIEVPDINAFPTDRKGGFGSTGV